MSITVPNLPVSSESRRTASLRAPSPIRFAVGAELAALPKPPPRPEPKLPTEAVPLQSAGKDAAQQK